MSSTPARNHSGSLPLPTVCALVAGSYRSFDHTWRSMRTHLVDALATAAFVATVMCLDQEPPREMKQDILASLHLVHLSIVEQLQVRQPGRSAEGFQRSGECFRRALQRELDCVPDLRARASSALTATLRRGQHASHTALRHAAPVASRICSHTTGDVDCAGVCAQRRVYDSFVFVRPDLYWIGDFPAEALHLHSAVSLRAQKLCFEPGSHWFSEQAQAAYHIGCHAR